jgi:stage III sporulation protein AF
VVGGVNPSIGRWIINLAVISMLGVAVDLLLPSGSMKRYVRFLIGIIILTAMLRPIFQAFGQLPNLERYTAQAFATMDFADVSYQVKWLEGQQQREIRNYFVESMESHMEQQIKQFKGYDHVRVDVEMDEKFHDESQLPDILKVYVDVGISADSHIEPVRINIDTKDVDISHADKPTKASKDEQEIKALLSSIYGIDQSRIEVRFQDSSHKRPSDNKQKVQGGELP